MFKLMLITNKPDLANFAATCGVDRIFVDLEILNKVERQGHLSTVISYHKMEDVPLIRKAIPKNELLVRLNPFYENTEAEVNQAINYGADILMLPMIEDPRKLDAFSHYVGGRAKIIPLIETPKATETLKEMVKIKGVSEIYIGLNDLHLALKTTFMFESLANGLVDQMAAIIKEAGLPFGFGGVARIGEGLLSADKILSEHIRLKSSSVILSRTFHRESQTLDQLNAKMDLKQEVQKLRDKYHSISFLNEDELLKNKSSLQKDVSDIVEKIKKERESTDVRK